MSRYQGWFLAISTQPFCFYVYIIKPKILSGDESNFGSAPSPKHIYEGFIRKFISEEKFFFFWERGAPFFQIRARNKRAKPILSPPQLFVYDTPFVSSSVMRVNEGIAENGWTSNTGFYFWCRKWPLSGNGKMFFCLEVIQWDKPPWLVHNGEKSERFLTTRTEWNLVNCRKTL